MYSSLDTIWTLVAAALVFFMQAGFAMVETGFTRAKNSGNIMMKNMMDFALGTIAYWVIGFGIMFAGSGLLIGGLDLFITGDYGVSGGYTSWTYVIFQTVFCATAATIVSGAMAERTRFKAYLIYSVLISALIYPVSGHWIWGGGWLAELGFHDFAGSTAVHMVGGVAALVGTKLLGPRIGKYSKSGKSRAIPGHSLTLGALGVFILWFGWFGFNGGSTVCMTGDDVLVSAGKIFVNTNLAAAVSTTAAMIIVWLRYGKPDVSMTLNGSLAGLVGITAGCDAVSPVGAAIIGLVSAFVVVFGVEFIDKVLKIDDPVGAISVHGLCGAAGTIMVGLLATDGGLFYGGGASFLGAQVIGVLSVFAWVFVTMLIIFAVIKKTVGLRVTADEEIAGLDITEHGLVSSYADFMPVVPAVAAATSVGSVSVSMPVSTVSPEEAVPVEKVSAPEAGDAKGKKMTKVAIVTRPNKLEDLKNAMNAIGVTGMTVTHVMGYGLQKGKTEYYRGVEVDPPLLPKVKVEIIVSKVPVKTVTETAKKALYTGHIGDGKIFVYDVENVIKVRTGEEGYDALQDD